MYNDAYYAVEIDLLPNDKDSIFFLESKLASRSPYDEEQNEKVREYLRDLERGPRQWRVDFYTGDSRRSSFWYANTTGEVRYFRRGELDDAEGIPITSETFSELVKMFWKY